MPGNRRRGAARVDGAASRGRAGAPDALPRRVRGVRTRAFRAFFRRALVPPPRSCRLFMLIVKFLAEVGKNPITVEEHCGTS